MKRALLVVLILVTATHASAPAARAWPYVLDCPCRKYQTLTKRIADKAEEASDYYAMAKGVWDPPRTAEEIRVTIELAAKRPRKNEVYEGGPLIPYR